MKYCRKLNRLIIANKLGIILTLSMNNILSIINENIDSKNKRASINAKQLNFIEYKSQNAELSALYINESTGDIIKALKNGEVIENNRILFINGGRGRIDYIKKSTNFVYISNFEGIIKKYMAKQFTNGQLSLLGYYDCKNSIIGL